MLQQKYFNFGELDDSIPMFAFVGRVVAQKGVLLIMDVAEHIIHKFDYKVQFLIGGPANMNDPYAAQCAHRMWALKAKYPNCFWAAPEEFFTDGSLVNRGADFGLMPSVFEPGGIVQHEFFVGATPVVAFKTGGLKDSVIEFLWDSEVGSGYTFESHTSGDLIFALDRAIGTFRNKPKYLKLRENAFKATMCGDEVSRAWLSEFYRLSGKIFVDYTIVNDLNSKFPDWSPADYTPISIIQEIFGSEKRARVLQDLDHGAEDEKNQADASPDRLMEIDNIMSAFDQAAYNKKPKTFAIHNRGPRHNCVEICGSFDDWQVRHEMSFDPFTNQWFVTIHLKPNQDFYYKYILNSDNWIVNDEDEKIDDGAGNVNNICRVTI